MTNDFDCKEDLSDRLEDFKRFYFNWWREHTSSEHTEDFLFKYYTENIWLPVLAEEVCRHIDHYDDKHLDLIAHHATQFQNRRKYDARAEQICKGDLMEADDVHCSLVGSYYGVWVRKLSEEEKRKYVPDGAQYMSKKHKKAMFAHYTKELWPLVKAQIEEKKIESRGKYLENNPRMRHAYDNVVSIHKN